MANNTITCYFRKEWSELNADMIRRAHAVKQMKRQCKALQEALSEKELKTLRHFASFQEEINRLSSDLDERILDLIPDKVSDSKSVPFLIDSLKIRRTNLKITCLRRIDDYLERTGDIQSVYQHHITAHLFYFCSEGSHRAKILALSILSRLSIKLDPAKDDWKVIWNSGTATAEKRDERGLILPIMELVSHKDASVRIGAIRFITKYAVTKDRRNLLFEHGITEHIVSSLDFSHSDFKTLVATMQMIGILCKMYDYRVMPLRKYTNRIVSSLNSLLFIDDDEILNAVFGMNALTPLI